MKSEPLPWSERPHALEWRVLAIACSVMLHVVLLAAGAVAAAVVAAKGVTPVLPRQPLLVLAVALVMAHCSLGAIWWTRSDLPTHARTVVAALSCGGLWLLLVILLNSTRHNGVAAGAWAACITTQVVLTGLITTALELALNYEAAATRSRFSVLFLLIWTSVIAATLGAAGAAAARSGFKLADVTAWEYFAQLQGVGLSGAALAIAIYAAVRFPLGWNTRVFVSIAAVLAISIAAQATLAAVFGDKVGAETADIVWLIAGEGLFLVATLVPLEMARERTYISK